VKNDKGVNQLTGPIELAMKLFLDQEGKIPEQIVGPQKQQRRQQQPGIPLDRFFPREEV